MVGHGRIVGVGAAGDPPPGVVTVTLPPGAVVAGAFADHHLHLLASAARHWSVDLSVARDLAGVFDLLAASARGDGAGGPWLRAWEIGRAHV